MDLLNFHIQHWASRIYSSAMSVEKSEKAELFIGLVGATGTDLSKTRQFIGEALTEFGYNVQQVKFSDFFTQPYFSRLKLNVDKSSAFSEVFSQMEAGNAVRKYFRSSSVLAKYAVQVIRGLRQNGTPGGNAFLFDSLKNPEEAKLLRETYGVGYYQVGVFCSEEDRVGFLEKKRGIKKSDAYALIEKDISEESSFGQQTRDTFHLSDFFIKFDPHDVATFKTQVERIFNLIFGSPHLTPTTDEHMMYMAYSFSARSGDLSRQVGAVLVNENGDVIGMGSNDVPRFGGGPYWPDSGEDWRDYRMGYDANEKTKNEIVLKVMQTFKPGVSNESLLREGLGLLEKTGLTDITEFNRATHAEMSAILSGARIGATTRGATIYCTTFPCHNCAKHIVESGVKRVLFVEPYPKSQAENLHGDAISINRREKSKVSFEHFIGVAARRYLDLFSMKLGMGLQVPRKVKETGDVTTFDRKTALVRVPLVVGSYLDKETSISAEFQKGNQNGQK